MIPSATTGMSTTWTTAMMNMPENAKMDSPTKKQTNLHKRPATPVYRAVREDSKADVEQLLTRGADVSWVIQRNEALPHCLPRRSPKETTALLQQCMTDSKARDSHGRTLVQCARESRGNDPADFIRKCARPAPRDGRAQTCNPCNQL